MTDLFDSGYYRETELQTAGFKHLGLNVQIAKNITLIGCQNISIQDNVRIDGFCTILAVGQNAQLRIGSHVHIGAYCYLNASDGIQMDDFSGLSQGVRIYSRTDDYSGKFLTNPTVPERYTGIQKGAVYLQKHVIIGSGTVILPKITIAEGAAVGAQSLVTKSLDAWGVYFGAPAKRIKGRLRDLLALEVDFRTCSGE